MPRRSYWYPHNLQNPSIWLNISIKQIFTIWYPSARYFAVLTVQAVFDGRHFTSYIQTHTMAYYIHPLCTLGRAHTPWPTVYIGCIQFSTATILMVPLFVCLSICLSICLSHCPAIAIGRRAVT